MQLSKSKEEENRKKMGVIELEVLERKTTIYTKEEKVYDASAIDFQVSYNSHGHLVLRWFSKDQTKRKSDVIITFTARETREIIEFIKRKLAGVW